MTTKFSQADVERQNTKVRVGRVLASVRADGKAQIPSPGLIAATLTPKTIIQTPKRLKSSQNGYNKAVVLAYFKEMGIPEPVTEYQFAHAVGRKWRFDFAWCSSPFTIFRVALEVDGGIWITGGHNRGTQMKKTWEKENEAQIIGWKILKCEPKDLCTKQTVNLIKRALGLTPINL